MNILNSILAANLGKVTGLYSKSDPYLQGIQVWVLSLTSIRKQPRAGNQGFNSLMFKGGYISSSSSKGEHVSWPWVQATGWKWTAYKTLGRVLEMVPGKGSVEKVTGEAYPLMDLQKVHEGAGIPYNVKVSLTPKILGSLFPGAMRDEVSIMAGAFPHLENVLSNLQDVQLHLTVGMSPETYASSEVKRMYSKKETSQECWEVQLTESDILGAVWVLPGDPQYIPGFHLGQIVNLVEEQVLHPEEHPPDVLQPSEVLPKSARVLGYIKRHYGPYVLQNKLELEQDYGLESNHLTFLGTLTGAFLKWVEIPENKEKALGALKKWKPQGSEGKVRSMEKEPTPVAKGGGMGKLPPVSSSSKKEDEFALPQKGDELAF
jgi:hypothetical protein